MPSLDALRSHTSSVQAAEHFIQGLDANVRTGILQRNPRKPGRYNIHEIPSSSAQYRWPNEGVNTAQGRRRVPYDELSLPQWVAGQLTNVLQVCDLNTQQAMINQVIATMRDAISLPWHAVRAAYAHSMHEVEEGRLVWSDKMQWSVNRLSATQSAMVNTQVVQPRPRTATNPTELRICRYHIEGNCTHNQDHGNYRHVCIPCYRARRPAWHREEACPQRGMVRGVENLAIHSNVRRVLDNLVVSVIMISSGHGLRAGQPVKQLILNYIFP